MEELKFDAKDIEANKVMAALSYLSILVLIPLLTKKNSKFVQTHAKQGLALFIVEVIVTFIVWIPFIGWLAALLVLIVSLWGFIVALQGKFQAIPGLYDLAKKLNI